MEQRQPHAANTVLVVEDDFLLRDFASGFLADSGFEVVEARDADEALATLRARPDIEVLFTDVNMPGSLNGIELAHEVERRFPHVSRLITSGKVLPEATPDHFIGKPYDPREVIASIRALLRAHRRPH